MTDTSPADFTNNIIHPDSIPDYQEVAFHQLDPAAPWDGFWGWMMFYIPLLGIEAAMLIMGIKFPLWVMALIIGATLLIAAISIWYNFASHKHFGYALREHDLLFRQGMFWQSKVIIPYNRIQHIEIHRNPVERKLDLASLKLFSAGGSAADMKIHGLPHNKAVEIRQFILDKNQSQSNQISNEKSASQSQQDDMDES